MPEPPASLTPVANAAVDTLLPAPSMTRTASYTIVITHTSNGYAAMAPAFPDLVGEGRGARVAYARLKVLLKARLLSAVAGDGAIPRDPVVQTRTLRIDLWYLQRQEELQ